jgi:hypothetical protein
MRQRPGVQAPKAYGSRSLQVQAIVAPLPFGSSNPLSGSMTPTRCGPFASREVLQTHAPQSPGKIRRLAGPSLGGLRALRLGLRGGTDIALVGTAELASCWRDPRRQAGRGGAGAGHRGTRARLRHPRGPIRWPTGSVCLRMARWARARGAFLPTPPAHAAAPTTSGVVTKAGKALESSARPAVQGAATAGGSSRGPPQGVPRLPPSNGPRPDHPDLGTSPPANFRGREKRSVWSPGASARQTEGCTPGASRKKSPATPNSP